MSCLTGLALCLLNFAEMWWIALTKRLDRHFLSTMQKKQNITARVRLQIACLFRTEMTKMLMRKFHPIAHNGHSGMSVLRINPL